MAVQGGNLGALGCFLRLAGSRRRVRRQ